MKKIRTMTKMKMNQIRKKTTSMKQKMRIKVFRVFQTHLMKKRRKRKKMKRKKRKRRKKKRFHDQ